MGRLPCDVKFIVEGDEEIGSPAIFSFVQEHKDKLAADACIWEFGGVNYDGAPTQALGMRGDVYVELSVQTAQRESHSGLGGSIFPNAAWRLVWALSSLKDDEEKILIPGFYDDVQPPSKNDLDLLAALPVAAEKIKETYGLKNFLGGLTEGLAFNRQAVFEPTCTICGLDSGYQGGGSKTIIPAKARANVDFRLVPNQSPQDILIKLRNHLDLQDFEDIVIKHRGSTPPARTAPEHPFVMLTNQMALEVYGKEPVISPMAGGSGPNYPFIETLNLPVVSVGVGYPGSAIHSPDEHIRIRDFINGIRHTAYIIEAFARS
jgi:acetylornithine deacetylase/succinyl-diaminopimelate desuccinylase-like protein